MNRRNPGTIVALWIAFCAIPLISVQAFAQTGVDMGCSPTVANPCTSTPTGSGTTTTSTLSPVVQEAAAALGAALGDALHKALFGDPAADARRAALLRQQQAIMAEEARLARIEAERLREEKFRRLMGNLKLSGTSPLELKSASADQGALTLKRVNPGGANVLELKLGDRGYGICGLPGIYTQGERPGCASSPTTPSAPPSSNAQTSSTGLTYKLGETSANGLNGLSNIGMGDGSKPFGIPGLPGIAINGPASAPVTSNPTTSLPLKSSDDLNHTAPATERAAEGQRVNQGTAPGRVTADAEAKTADLHGEKPSVTPAANQLENVEVQSKQALNAKTDEELSAKAGAPFDNGVAGAGAVGGGVRQPELPVTSQPVPSQPVPSQPVSSQPVSSQPGGQSDSPSSLPRVPSSIPPPPPNRTTATASGGSPDGFKKSSDEDIEKSCGIPRRFAVTFRGVMLINRSSIAMFQRVNLAATELLEREGAFPKPLAIKRKTGTVAEVAPYIVYENGMKCPGGCRTRDMVITKTINGKTTTTTYSLLVDPDTDVFYTSDLDLLALAHIDDPDRPTNSQRYGKVTPTDERLIKRLNSAARFSILPKFANRDPESPDLIAHGAANFSPDDEDLVPPKYPVCSFEPTGEVIVLENEAMLKKYFNSINDRGYKTQPDGRWNWGEGPPWKIQ